MSNEIFQSQSLNDWLFYLEQQHPTEIELGLTRIQSVADKAKLNDLNAGKTVLVAGTNGKGTTIRFIELALIELGYSVGVFSSPHLFTYNERVRVNGELLADSDHISAFDFVEQHKGNTSLTYFEFSTLAAFKLFQQHKLDFVLVEVGLGGRLDSTNILHQDISVITSIGLDHVGSAHAFWRIRVDANLCGHGSAPLTSSTWPDRHDAIGEDVAVFEPTVDETRQADGETFGCTRGRHA